MQKLSSLSAFARTMLRSKLAIGILTVVVLIGAYFVFFKKDTAYQFVVVERGDVTELVSITGNTTPVSSVSLGFGNSGTISSIYSAIGKTVWKGQILAKLNTADLDALVAEARATLTQRLAENQNTTINVDQVRAEQDRLVKNAYTKLLSADLEAAPSSSSYDTDPPEIKGLYDGPEGTYKLTVEQSNQLTTDSHNLFTFDLEKTGPTKISATEATRLGTRGLYLSFGSALTSYDNTTWYVTTPNTKGASYVTNYNAYQAALRTRESAISSAEAEIRDAGKTTVAEAQVENARAAVQNAEAKLQNSRIVAPISGVVTIFDAKVGEFASPGTPLISIISKDAFEVDAQVSEIDVGKIARGNTVMMTLDAFPGEVFDGSVFYIDPAQTNTEGVVGYKIKVAFDKPDARIKSGLTANIDIKTRSKEDVLYLPQHAIVQTDEGTFVETLENGKPERHPVVLGIADQKGNVEIISGVSEGEKVLNIGLKEK